MRFYSYLLRQTLNIIRIIYITNTKKQSNTKAVNKYLHKLCHLLEHEIGRGIPCRTQEKQTRTIRMNDSIKRRVFRLGIFRIGRVEYIWLNLLCIAVVNGVTSGK